MPDNTEQNAHLTRLEKLLAKRKEILSMEGEKALEAILDMKDALPLVHSFPEEDFYFLINDIGVDDAVPILGMASTKQWEYIIDTEIWDRDRIKMVPVLKWFDLLQQADADRLITWLKDENTEFFEYCLYKNIEVRIREHDEDPSDFGEGYFTVDDVYYVKFIDDPFSPPMSNTTRENRNVVLSRLLTHLAQIDYLRYQKILFETSSIIPSEIEEEMYRLRNVRLAEKGFLPFDEALGIYQPFSQWEKKIFHEKNALPEKQHHHLAPISLYPSMMVAGDDLLAIALGSIQSGTLLLDLQTEFAALCNRIIAADQKIIQEREQLNEIVKKACGYISIGLQQLSGESNIPNPDLLSALIQKYSLELLFRTGYGLALELKFEAERFQNNSYYTQHGQTLSFWGENGMGTLGGLLVKKPLYFDNFISDTLYREFNSLNDILQTQKVLSDIIALDHLISRFPIVPKPLEGHLLTYKNFLLTLWARDYLTLTEELTPIPLPRFITLFKALFPYNTDSDKKKATRKQESNKIDISMKTNFLKWISEKSDMPETNITEKLGHLFNDLFDEVEGEYGKILIKDLDPRYIYLFLLE